MTNTTDDKPTIPLRSLRKQGRALGYYVREGSYYNTTDDRIGRWYIGHDADDFFRPFGRGYPSERAAWIEVMKQADNVRSTPQ